MSDKYTETEASVRQVLSTLWSIARGTLYNVRLSAAERLTLLMSAIALGGIATILVTAVLLFVSIGAARLLASLTPHGAYFIVAGFYALLLIVIVSMRRKLITDPIARLVSRLILDDPDAPATNPNSEPHDTPDK